MRVLGVQTGRDNHWSPKIWIMFPSLPHLLKGFPSWRTCTDAVTPFRDVWNGDECPDWVQRGLIPALAPAASLYFLLSLAVPELYTNPCFVLLCRYSANKEKHFIFSIFIFRCWEKIKRVNVYSQSRVNTQRWSSLLLFLHQECEQRKVSVPVKSPWVIPSPLIIFFKAKNPTILRHH